MKASGDFIFTSESVGEGHPDKICDQISDAVLDEAIDKDAASRVACECFVTTGMVLVGGEITTHSYVDVQRLARGVLKAIGYDNPSYGIDYESCAVMNMIHDQSPDIAQGVDTGGAGDQGMMFGYACRDTPELMPAPIQFAHQIMRTAADVRKKGQLPFLRPDGKCQVTVEYRDWKPVRVSTVVLSHQHSEDVGYDELKESLVEEIIKKTLPAHLLSGNVTYLINPTGRFVVGGPYGDTGLTGRKIIVDTYGGMARHGGGAFSGKDPSKVDRSAAYMMRYVARHIVSAGLAERCELQVAYAIGVAEPVSLLVDTMGTGAVPDARLAEAVRKVFDLTPRGIIKALDLRKPIFRSTAVYGHFGRPGFAWERADKVEELKRAAG